MKFISKNINKYKGVSNLSIIRASGYVNTKSIQDQIYYIDREINNTVKELIKTQIVRWKLVFSSKNNVFDKLQERWYKNKIEQSTIWHLKELKKLVAERRELEIKLDKSTGRYWSKVIKRCLYYLGFVLLLGLTLSIVAISFGASLLIFAVMSAAYLIYSGLTNVVKK